MLKAFVGGYCQVTCSVVANTESEALGLLLEEYQELRTDLWCVYEVDLSQVGINELHSGGVKYEY